MKGQMFIIAAIIIIISIVILKSIIGTYSVTGEKESLETNIPDRNLKNVENEYLYLAGIATTRPDSAAYYFSNFSDYLYDEKLRGIYVFVFSNTSQEFSVITGNYAGNSMNVEISVDYSSPSSDSFSLGNRNYHTSNFIPTSNSTRLISLTYTMNSETFTEKIPLKVSEKNFVSAFFDIKFENAEMMVRKKFLYNRTW